LYAQGEGCDYSQDQKPFRPSPFFPARDLFDQFSFATEEVSFFKATTGSSIVGDARGGLRSFQCRCHRVSQRQSCRDNDYSEGDELDQIIWPFSVGVSIAKEPSSSNAQRVGSFHVYNTPFTNEMTISW
jgi:hypothetical protein